MNFQDFFSQLHQLKDIERKVLDLAEFEIKSIKESFSENIW